MIRRNYAKSFDGYSNDKQIIKQKYKQFKITCVLNALRLITFYL